MTVQLKLRNRDVNQKFISLHAIDIQLCPDRLCFYRGRRIPLVVFNMVAGVSLGAVIIVQETTGNKSLYLFYSCLSVQIAVNWKLKYCFSSH